MKLSKTVWDHDEWNHINFQDHSLNKMNVENFFQAKFRAQSLKHDRLVGTMEKLYMGSF